jgi:hypothetical protein
MSRHLRWLAPLLTAVVYTLLAVSVNIATESTDQVWAWVAVGVFTLALAYLTADRFVASRVVQFDRSGIGRYNFWFNYPKGWARQDPENADGHTYADQSTPQVSVSFWGSRTDDIKPPSDRQPPRGETRVASRESGGYLRWLEGGVYHQEAIPGWQIEAVSETPDGHGLHHLYQWFDAGWREIGFHAQAPTSLYPQYLGLFQDLLGGIAIERDEATNPAPPRGSKD